MVEVVRERLLRVVMGDRTSKKPTDNRVLVRIVDTVRVRFVADRSSLCKKNFVRKQLVGLGQTGKQQS